MTITTASPARDPRRPDRGFSLVEMLIGSTLAGVILTAVMSTFIFLGKSGASVGNYNDMESQSRRSLEEFAQDTRQGSAITWNSATSVTLIVNSTNVTWAYASGTLTRQVSTGQPRTMITGISSFEFVGFKLTDPTTPIDLSDLAAASRLTKQLQISLEVERRTRTVARSTNLVLSARFILRNKRVTT